MFAMKIMYTSSCLFSRKNNQYRRVSDVEDSMALKKPTDQEEPTLDLTLWSITKLGLILAYFYVSDRTNYLLKENK